MQSSKFNILLTGGSGQLGQELLKLRAYDAPDRYHMDIRDYGQVERYLQETQPDLIVHAAAYTDTLMPERYPQEAVKCYQTNVIGTRNLVAAATCPIIYISTESAVHPYNFYILTKMMGEWALDDYLPGYTILRTSFRDDPFEYDKAATDMYTIADTVAVIAPIIDSFCDMVHSNQTIYVGTGIKTVYELAKRSKPDVMGLPRTDIDARLPSMEELLDVA